MANNCYFSHDSNARNDKKLLAVRMKHKMCGYGCYFALLEMMRESEDYTLPRDYNLLAFELRESADVLKSICENFGLFEFSDDGKTFFSKGFIKRMSVFEEKQKLRTEAGKKAVRARWEKEPQSGHDTNVLQSHYERNTNVLPSQCERNTNSYQINKSKRKEKEADASCAHTREIGGGALFDEIFSAFTERTPGLMETPGQRAALGRLLAFLGGGPEAEEKVRQGLEKLRSAKAVTSGKVRIPLASFLKPDVFVKLISGAFDVDYSAPKIEPNSETRNDPHAREQLWRTLGYQGNCWDMQGNPPAWENAFWDEHPDAMQEFKKLWKERSQT